MSISGPVPKYDLLTPDQRQHAWQIAYLNYLDQHPDLEIGWEAERWREMGAHGIAHLCEALLQERRVHDFSIPADTTPGGLTALWQQTPHSEVLRWVRSGGLCLLAALR